MGYYTSVDGEITITPSLTWAEITGATVDFVARDYGARLRLVEETVETDDGTLTRKTADAIIPLTDDTYKAYSLVEDVQRIIDAFPSHTFTGRLDCEGEDAGDLWRVVVRDGRRAVKVEPRIVWPDDTEGGGDDGR